MGRGNTLYILDEPTTGLHPADVEKLMAQLDGLVESGNPVLVVEHDMRVVVSGTPAELSKSSKSRTAPYLARFLAG